MKKLIFFGFLISFLFIVPARAAFVEGLEDIPLADGLSQIDSESLNFGNEESRLVEAFFKAESTNFEQIKAFYKNTLPQMGWKLKKADKTFVTFEREGEILDICAESQTPLTIRLTVKSKNQ